MELIDRLKRVTAEALAKIEVLDSVTALQDYRVSLLGKKGELTGILRGMGTLSPADRPSVGQLANKVRDQIEVALEAKTAALAATELAAKLTQERVDVTLPGRQPYHAHVHPLNRIIEEATEIFLGLGFSVAEGPEIESEYYNFEALNVPPLHPARDMQDSFYLHDGHVLRTQTSPVQVRTMQALSPHYPIRIISPGKVYRRDDDATHSPMFHQIEGLVIDKDISLAHLKSILLMFARQMFGAEREIRLRPSYFPFTEPSAEVDVSCGTCGGRGCKVCKGTGWVEILGCGMVHPAVLSMSGYDPEEVNGFAFGMGVERIAMLKYNVEDLRHFFVNDYRFVRQF
ncbi:MAG: Phenylalanine--tRNA ligase alpha subunit [Firmicutes bacterium]|nr:Phenylalanine--tRNA ligase alpha subunit [candidate division NPL-UPA2 bacterium]MBT9153865.1 Phenylalanine--tRNA ligase alpha subunit [candidate division NPL-UPA2 bacterium]